MDATCTIQDSIHVFSLVHKYVSRILGTYQHSDIAVTLNVYTHVGLEDAEKELQKMQGLENARKEMGISDKDDKPLKQNMFKVI